MDYQSFLSRKLTTLFPNESDRLKAVSILANYGPKDYEREPARVRLAILKLSGADPERVKTYINLAKIDYRDVLALAEYPRQLKLGVLLDGEEKNAAIEADKMEYDDWLAE